MRHASRIAAAALCWAAASAAWGYQPAVNYQLRCMGCHLPDGSGQAGRVPSIRRTLVLFSASREGRNYVMRVPGVAQSPLSDLDTAALLNWMARNLSDLKAPADFANYTAAEVHDARVHPLVRVKAIRARLLNAAAKAARSPAG